MDTDRKSSPEKDGKRQCQLLYLLYGGAKEYEHEAKFSILTALANRRTVDGFDITIMAEHPHVFDGWPVRVIEVTKKTLDEWTGTHNYLHRRKACAIAAGAQLAEKTIFVDADTFFCESPEKLFEKVSSNRFLVDEFEWTWSTGIKRPAYKDLAADLAAKNQSPESSLPLYNSGIFGVTRDDAPMMNRVIERIDAWGGHARKLHTVEQIALSFELKDKFVSQARGVAQHYYRDKVFFHKMLAVFFRKYGEEFNKSLLWHTTELPQKKIAPTVLRRAAIKWHTRKLGPKLNRIAKNILYGLHVPSDPYSQACKEAWWGHALRGLSELNDVELDQLKSFGVSHLLTIPSEAGLDPDAAIYGGVA